MLKVVWIHYWSSSGCFSHFTFQESQKGIWLSGLWMPSFKESRDGAVVRALASHQCDRVWFPVPVSYVGWVCCWFSSLLRGFFSGFSGFPPSTKTNISKFHLVSVVEEPLCGGATANSNLFQFIYLLFILGDLRKIPFMLFNCCQLIVFRLPTVFVSSQFTSMQMPHLSPWRGIL